MNGLFHAAFRAMCGSLVCLLVAAMVVVSQGIAPEARVAFRRSPPPHPLNNEIQYARRDVAPPIRPRPRARGPVTLDAPFDAPEIAAAPASPDRSPFEPSLVDRAPGPAVRRPPTEATRVSGPRRPPRTPASPPPLVQLNPELEPPRPQVDLTVEPVAPAESSDLPAPGEPVPPRENVPRLAIEAESEDLAPPPAAEPTNQQFAELAERVARLQAAADRLAAAPPSEAPPVARVARLAPGDGAEPKFDLEVKQADIREAFALLAHEAGWNLLTSSHVAGPVTVQLRQVTAEEALRALTRAQGLEFERDGDFVYVFTAAEAESQRQRSRKTAVRWFRPQYLTVAQLERLVQPLLTPEIGRMSIAAAGADHREPPALVVQDLEPALEQVERMLEGVDVPPLQISVEAQIIAVTCTDGSSSGLNFAALQKKHAHFFVIAQDGPVPDLAPARVTRRGLKCGYLSAEAGPFLDALKSLGEMRVVASQQILVADRQRAELFVGPRIGSPVAPHVWQGGTRLSVVPQATADGLVLLDIHPERSTAALNPFTGQPLVQAAELSTRVLARDGATIVLAGLTEEGSQEQQRRSKVFAGVPLLKTFFQHQRTTDRCTELVVLLTPRIITDPSLATAGPATAPSPGSGAYCPVHGWNCPGPSAPASNH